MNGQRLQVVDNFTYPASMLSRAVYTDDEVNVRIAKTRALFDLADYVQMPGIEDGPGLFTRH